MDPDNEPPVLRRQENDNSDNESMGIPEHDMTQDFNRFESDIKEQMSTIATQVRESILGLSEQMTSRFQDLDSQVRRLE